MTKFIGFATTDDLGANQQWRHRTHPLRAANLVLFYLSMSRSKSMVGQFENSSKLSTSVTLAFAAIKPEMTMPLHAPNSAFAVTLALLCASDVNAETWLCHKALMPKGEPKPAIVLSANGPIKVNDREISAEYREEGGNLVWYWGRSDAEKAFDYRLVLAPTGTLRYYDLRGVGEGGPVAPSRVYHCGK